MYNPLTAFLSSSTSRAATSVLNYPRSIDPRTANSSSHSHLANRRTTRTDPSFISAEDVKKSGRSETRPSPR